MLTRRIARVLREALEHGGIGGDRRPGNAVGREASTAFASWRRLSRACSSLTSKRTSSFAKKLYRAFEENGFRPWLDKKRLMPGQNWPRAIETAIQTSDFFVACFSRRATSKRGSFHSELRYALFCAAKVPLDEIFLIPLRLDDCLVPSRISKQTQYLDLFPDWEAGVSRLIAVIKAQNEGRKRKRLPLAG